MRRVLGVLAMLAVMVLHGPALDGAVASDRIWFSPGPGTLDYLDLFQHPDAWPHARALVSVFKFYQGHTQTPTPPATVPNSYTALAGAGAFRLVNAWGKKIALEVGAVKEFYCTDDAGGMKTAIADTVASMQAVQAAGGTVTYLAMDEPWVSGRSRQCGGPALEPTADRVATYIRGVHAAYPAVQIGLIEAYPFSSATAIEQMLALMSERGTPPAFLHMDVDWHLSGAAAFQRDMRRLSSTAASQRLPFGIIITGYDGDADALYAQDAYGITDLIQQTFGTWESLPDHLIFQSWAESRTGLRITPSNLPETRAFTHTNLLWDIFRRLRGATAPPIGSAVIRH